MQCILEVFSLLCSFEYTKLKSKYTQGGGRVQSYAVVIIATPLEDADLNFQNVSLPHIPKRIYQDTVTTVVRGSLQASFFNLTTLPQGSSSNLKL